MPTPEKYSVKKQAMSFRHALNGLIHFVKTEPKALVHLGVDLFAIILGFYFGISTTEWALLVISMGALLGMELLNTSVEELCDFLHPNIHPSIKVVKDVSSAAVLAIAIATAIVALIIFIPYL